jgi:hypothetical protein
VRARAAGRVEREKHRDALRAGGEIVELDRTPTVAHLKILKRQVGKAFSARVGDDHGDCDEIGVDAQDFVVFGHINFWGRLRADGRAEKENQRRREKIEQETGAGSAREDVSPGTKWTRKGHAAVRLKQKSPEEQDRQDDRDGDDDDLNETHDLNLKLVGGQSY